MQTILPSIAKVRRHQGGFTLIEMLAVIIIIAILVVIFGPSLFGTTEQAKAVALVKTANTISQNVNALAQTCGVSTDVNASQISTTGDSTGLISVIMTGKDAAQPQYQGCVQMAGIRPLDNSFVQQGGGWSLYGYVLDLSGGGLEPISVTYKDVPDSIVVRAIQQKYSNVTDLPTAQTAIAAGTDFKIAAGSVSGTENLSIVIN